MAILRLRRGSSAELTSTTLLVGEPFFNTDTDTLVVGSDESGSYITLLNGGATTGSLSILGDITASNILVNSDIRINGNIYLGNELADNIEITALISSSLVPSSSVFTIGSSGTPWGTVYGNVIVGAISASNGIVSGSSQISHSLLADLDANEHIDHSTIRIRGINGLAGAGFITGNIDLNLDTTSTTFITGTRDVLASDVVHSGSYLGTATTQNLTEHSSNLYYTDARVKTKLNTETVVSGSSQLTSSYDLRYENIGTGIISGSDQLTSSLDIRYQLSGSSTGLPAGVVSGSDQLTSSFEQVGTGIVSGSSQIDATSVANFDSNVDDRLASLVVHSGSYLGTATTQNLSEHSSNLYYTDARVKTKLTIEGVISGSSQLTSSFDARYQLSGSVSNGVLSSSFSPFVTGGMLFVGEDGQIKNSSSLYFSSSNQVVLPNGSLTLPSLTFESSSNTGIYWTPSSMVFVANGQAKFRVASSQGVKLDAQLQNTSFQTIVSAAGLPGSGFIPDFTGTSNGSVTASVLLGSIAATNGVVSGSSQVTFSGITGKPTLVSGSSQISYTGITDIPANIVSGSSQLSGSSLDLLTLTAGNLYISGNQLSSSNSNGNLEVKLNGTGQILIKSGAVATPSIGFIGDTGTGIYSTSGILRFTSAGTEIMRMGAAGLYIGVGLRDNAGNLIFNGGTAQLTNITSATIDNIVIDSNAISSSTGPIILSPSSSDFTYINSDLLPSASNTYDLGSSTREWTNLHLGSTLYLQNNSNYIVRNGSGMQFVESNGTMIFANNELNVAAVSSSNSISSSMVYVSSSLEIGGQFYQHQEYNNGNSITISWNQGNFHRTTLTGSATFSFNAPSGATTLLLHIVNGATSNTASWPASVLWPSASGVPALTSTSESIDIISFYYDGTNYFGFAEYNFI